MFRESWAQYFQVFQEVKMIHLTCPTFQDLSTSSGETREDKDAYLYSLDQQHSLWIILVSLQDEVSQFVDDDVQRTLLLQRLAEVQLRKEG